MDMQNCYHCIYGFQGKGLSKNDPESKGKIRRGNCGWVSQTKFPLTTSIEPILIENDASFNACPAYIGAKS